MAIKRSLRDTQAYFALALMYGDVGGTYELRRNDGGAYEPQRNDGYRAQFCTILPDPLPPKCMFVHVTDGCVMIVLRSGNKAGQDIDQNLTVKSPMLADMLRKWMPHAASAQTGTDNPYVMFKLQHATYGKQFNEDSYGKLLPRAWKRMGHDPEQDTKSELTRTDKGHGCDWARKVVGRARRGVVCKEGETADKAGAATQGHAPATERESYRSI